MPTLHLVLVAFWGGIVATEAVLELLPLWRPALRPAAAAFHYYVDLFVELPVLLGVAATGLLLLRGRSFDARLAWKVGCGLAAVTANLVCIAFVIARERGRDARRTTRIIFASAAVGLPAAGGALVLGAGYAGWLG